MKVSIIAGLLFTVFVIGCWIGNFVKLTNCDFKSDYKCEAIHGAGIIPPVSLVSVWFGTDD
jgi:hypothetical protein